MKKIEKWLKDRGYTCRFIETELWRHTCGFHSGETYRVDLYRISNNMYIRAKEENKRLFYVYRNKDHMLTNCVDLLDFTQDGIINRAGHLFPPIEKENA